MVCGLLLYLIVKNNIFCSRDRFGIKPFYYTEVANKFIFGSEIKQLLEFHPNNIVNKSILIDYLVTRFEDYNNDTFFEGVKRLPQSHNLIYDLNNHSYEIKDIIKFHLTMILKNIP